MSKFKLVIFDMDGTLIAGRTVFVFAENKGFEDELLRIINGNKELHEKSIEIAKLLKGMNARELLEIFRNIPLQEHVENVIREIKKEGIKTAIVTDSYQFVADDLRERLDIDYAFANNLIIEKDIVTGELIVNNKDLKKRFNDCKIHSICKDHVLKCLCKKLGISESGVIAVGDGAVDICMIKSAGLGIAFNAPKEVQKHADISTSNMSVILDYI